MRLVLLAALAACSLDRRMQQPEPVEQVRVQVIDGTVYLQDTPRIYRHLANVEAELRAEGVSEVMLQRLHAYREARSYPHNHDVPGRVPVFVDRHGTRCAMAALIESTGATDFVQRIALTRNNAFIDELAGDAELIAWLDRYGLTVQQAARIQPAYDSFHSCIFGTPFDLDPETPELEADIVAAVTVDGVTTSATPCGSGTKPCYQLMHYGSCQTEYTLFVDVDVEGRAHLHAEILVE